MNLIYIRHAIAMEREDFALYCLKKGIEPDDENRPLTKAGERRMLAAAGGLKIAFRSLDLVASPTIVTSPLLRARKTAEIISHSFYGKKTAPTKSMTVCEELRPGRSPEDFRNWLYDYLRSGRGHRVLPQETVLVVGHEPSLSQQATWWLSSVAQSKIPIKKGGAVCLEIGNALRSGEARLLWALPPWALRALNN